MKYKKVLLVLLGLTMTLVLPSCGEIKSNNEGVNQQIVVKPKKIIKDTLQKQKKSANNFNEVSAILAGMSDSSSAFNHLLDSVAWKENQNFMNQSWKKLEVNRLNKLVKWSDKELKAANKDCKTVFYPFSGPDFLTVNAFFPKADKMILLGLEPIGSLPPIHKYSNESAKFYANDFKKSLTDIFDKSYFITQYMLRDFQKHKVNGLLPVLCFFIKKTNHRIINIRYLVRHNNDSITEVDYNTKQKIFGVKVTCEKDNITKNIYYFRYDVSNPKFNDSSIFYKFVNANTVNSVTYIKSASYLLHANFMSNMKKLILKNSNYLLEDDTGIPYDDIEKTKEFSIKLYGRYIQPIKNFPYLRMQTGIVKAFAKDSSAIPDLPFHLGYHWQSKKDLLIYATKKQIKK